MKRLQIHCEDEALGAELIQQLLAFAQARRLGLEHDGGQRLRFYRGAAAAGGTAAPGSAGARIIAFPVARTVRRA